MQLIHLRAVVLVRLELILPCSKSGVSDTEVSVLTFPMSLIASAKLIAQVRDRTVDSGLG